MGSALETKVYTFLHRVTYQDTFKVQVFTQYVDMIVILAATIAWTYLSVSTGYKKAAIIVFFSACLASSFFNHVTLPLVGAGLSLPLIISLIIINRFRVYPLLHYDSQLSINYVTFVAIILASLGIVSLIFFLISGQVAVGFEKFPYAIYQQLLSIFTPLIVALLVFCIPMKVLLSQLARKVKNRINLRLVDIVPESIGNKHVAIYLSLSIALGVALSLAPHLQTINPHNERVGVDTPLYVEWLTQMDKQNGSPIIFAFTKITTGDRPLSMILLYAIVQSTKVDPFFVVEYSPSVLTPLLILVTFFLTRELTSNDRISIISSFLAAISFQTLIGIYSGFYANWIALLLGYLGFVLLIKCMRSPSKFRIMALSMVMISVLLAHVHTWTVIISVAFVFLVVSQIFNYYPKKNILILYFCTFVVCCG